MNKPRILLADDHMLILDGLRHLLERHYDLVGTVQDGHSVLNAARRLQPDLILMDVAMPVLNGLQAGQRLRQELPNVKLLYVSMYGDTPYVEEALRIGASGYVLKRSGWEELSRAIEAVLAGKQYVSPDLSAALSQPAVQPPTAQEGTIRSLTERQRQILRLVAAGYTAKEIGRMLHITSKTVEFHKGRMMRQLQLQSTVELARYALTHGLSNL
ncbi:MAG TPA: response regulator transcription factor [Nitrospira sp.]|jgi:DNA-binding NarL/FixJ family response regulator|nr:response regulator transcription factor [Nitrospira sp.]